MSMFGLLLYPTFPRNDYQSIGLKEAMALATRVLQENGLEDLEVVPNRVNEWNGYFLCPYRNIENPEIAYGGGAALVVRKKDGLSGMVHVPPEWMEQDTNVSCAPIDLAFGKCDNAND